MTYKFFKDKLTYPGTLGDGLVDYSRDPNKNTCAQTYFFGKKVPPVQPFMRPVRLEKFEYPGWNNEKAIESGIIKFSVKLKQN